MQPRGPYWLLGWSLGGLIAFEMATILKSRGEQVSLLGLVDAQLSTQHQPAADNDPRDEPDQARRELPAALLRLAGDERLRRVVENIDRVSSSYRPQRYDGDLLFFSSTDAPLGDRPAVEVWASCVSGVIRNVELGCQHHRMLDPGPAAVIGQAISAELLRVLGSPMI